MARLKNNQILNIQIKTEILRIGKTRLLSHQHEVQNLKEGLFKIKIENSKRGFIKNHETQLNSKLRHNHSQKSQLTQNKKQKEPPRSKV